MLAAWRSGASSGYTAADAIALDLLGERRDYMAFTSWDTAARAVIVRC